MVKNLSIYKLISMMAIMLFATPSAWGAGIRFGGDDAQGGLNPVQPNQGAQPEQSQRDQSQRLGGERPSPAQSGRDVLMEAEKLKARYRQKQSEAAGTANEHRYGFVVAFFDSESLLDPMLVKELNQLKAMDGVKFALFNSANKLKTPITERGAAELRRLENLDPPMARDDTGGHIAKQYNVSKFPTILYETPNHDVVRFYVPNTLGKVFNRIEAEKRKQARR